MSNLQLGYGRVDITPTFSVSLTGYGNDALRFSENVLDPIYATCLAFTDETGETALVYAMDAMYAGGWMREPVSKAVGVPSDHINFSASHSHATPGNWPELEYPGNKEYLLGTFIEGIIEAAKIALADRKPAQMFITDRQVLGLNFVRHYLTEDGTYCGPNFGNNKLKMVAHESEADHQLQLVKFVREGGKDVLVCNFQGHQTFTGGMNKTDISADFCGVVRQELEQALDCHVAYFSGASGNVNCLSKIPGEQRLEKPSHITMGKALAGDVLEVMDTFRPVETGRVQTCQLPLDVDVNHSLDHLKDIAEGISAEWKATGDRVKCNEMCHAVGLNSVYHAESVLDKLALGKTLDIQLNVVSIGDVAFAMVPYEMFDTNGMQLKERSPYKMTVIATCSNDVRSYIPSALGFEHGGYSVDRCRFVPGTGERMVDEFVGMLTKLKEND